MIYGDYEWDDAKAAANLAKHGIDFTLAIKAFDDPQAITMPDTRRDYGEDRRNLFGMVHLDDQTLLLLVVCHLARGRIRIISARPANRRERHHHP